MEERAQVADQMVRIVEQDPARLAALKADPLAALQSLRDEALSQVPVYFSDPWLYRMAVVVLGALALIAALGSVVLVNADKTTPEVLVALGSAAVGALVGLFAPSPTQK